MRNPNTDSKTVKSINTKSAAARAADALTGTAANSAANSANTVTGKKLSPRQINAEFKKNHMFFKENQEKFAHANIMANSYVGKYANEMGYFLKPAVEMGENGELFAKLYVYYVGENILGYSKDQVKDMLDEENCVGALTYLCVVNEKLYIKVYNSKEGWSFAKREIEKIICRHYCILNSLFDFDKYKQVKEEKSEEYEVIKRKKKK